MSIRRWLPAWAGWKGEAFCRVRRFGDNRCKRLARVIFDRRFSDVFTGKVIEYAFDVGGIVVGSVVLFEALREFAGFLWLLACLGLRNLRGGPVDRSRVCVRAGIPCHCVGVGGLKGVSVRVWSRERWAWRLGW